MGSIPLLLDVHVYAKEKHLGMHGMKQIFRNLINRSNIQRVKKATDMTRPKTTCSERDSTLF